MGFLDWLGITTPRKPLEIGDAAPDIVSHDEHGQEVRLADFYHSGYTLIYFYPKADTFGCTIQACNLRDAFDELKARGIRVVGVSADRPELQTRFKEKFYLPFTLLTDEKREVAAAFGVRLLLGMPHRESFLIKDGRVVWRDLNASPSSQAQEILKVVEKLG